MKNKILILASTVHLAACSTFIAPNNQWAKSVYSNESYHLNTVENGIAYGIDLLTNGNMYIKSNEICRGKVDQLGTIKATINDKTVKINSYCQKENILVLLPANDASQKVISKAFKRGGNIEYMEMNFNILPYLPN